LTAEDQQQHISLPLIRQQVPNGFRQTRFEYQMKIVLSRRHLAPNLLKIELSSIG